MSTDGPTTASFLMTRRSWLRLVAVVAVVFVLIFVFVLWLLTHLEHPWVKSRIEGALSNAVGTSLTYERLSISPFSGVELEGLRVATPETLREHAEEMLRLDRLDLPIEPGPLFSGDIVVPGVEGGALALTIVVDEDGRSSLSELAGPDELDEEPATPLSQSLTSLEDLSLRVGPIRLAPIRVRVLQVADGVVKTQSELASLAITSEGIELMESPRGSLRVAADQGDQVAVVVGDGTSTDRRATLVPELEVGLTDNRSVEATLHVGVVEQSLFPELARVDVLTEVGSAVVFLPEDEQTRLEVRELSVFDSMLAANLSALVSDDSTVLIDGEGAVEMAALPWALPWLTVDDLSAKFEVAQLEVESVGVTSGDAKVTGNVSHLRYEEDGSVFAIRQGDIDAMLSAPEGATRTLGLLTVEASIGELETDEPDAYRAVLSGFDAKAALNGVAADDEGMWGLRGKGSLDGSVKRVFVDVGTEARGRNASLDLDVDLARKQFSGEVPVELLTFKERGLEPIKLRRAALLVLSREPLEWFSDEGNPWIQVEASVARVSMGDKHFRSRKWTLDVERLAVDRYALKTRIRADRVSWGRFRQDPESTLFVEAVYDAARPAVDATGTLSIAGKAETTLELAASHDAPNTRYEVEFVGTHAGPLLGALLFDDGGEKTDELDFTFTSRGDFQGLLRKTRDGSLRPSKEPLRTVRGEHASTLRIERASLTRDGILHELDGVTFTASSTHQAPGRGRFDAALSLDEARYGEAGWELTLRDYQHELEAAYAALYGAPSFAVTTKGTLGEALQPYFRQYPVRDVVFGADVDVDSTQVVAVRQAFFRNPAGGTKFEARAAYEGWQDAGDKEVCLVGTEGCPEVASMYGRKAAIVTGAFEQDFSFWKSTERTKSSGTFSMPFTVETGDLSTYRVTAAAEIQDVMLELPQYGLRVEDLDALIPVEQELATNPRFFIVPSKKANAMAQKRFFDLYPFTMRDSFFTVDEVQLGQERIGPIAANVQVVGATLAMDQLHAAYRSGFITGQVLGDLSVEDPKFVFRGNITGVETTDGRGVLDANVAMTFVPTTLILEGKAQVVRISKDHLYELLDALDPYHEDEDLNRVRLGLKFGYPKFVLLKLDEGLMNAKIDLGGLAGAVRIDEIKGIPVTPFIEQYVQPYIEQILSPTAAARAMILENEGT